MPIFRYNYVKQKLRKSKMNYGPKLVRLHGRMSNKIPKYWPISQKILQISTKINIHFSAPNSTNKTKCVSK